MVTRSVAADRRTCKSKSRDKVNSFTRRFGSRLAEYGVAAAPLALDHYQGELGLSFAEVGFIKHILSYKWDERDPYPSLELMAQRTGYSVRTLQRLKAGLIRKGLLKVEKRYDERGGRLSDQYNLSLLFARLEELIQRDFEGRPRQDCHPYPDRSVT